MLESVETDSQELNLDAATPVPTTGYQTRESPFLGEMEELTQQIIQILGRKNSYKDNSEIDLLKDYFKKFDFLKGQNQDEKAKLIRPDEQQTSMSKDKKTVENICHVARHLKIPKHQIVFDYNSQGDLFYMVLHGNIACKVPVQK